MSDTTHDSAKRWVPTDWVDEITPPPRETPDAWIGQRADGTPVLIGCYDGPIGEQDEEGYGNPVDLTDGAEVAFTWHRHWGTATVTVAADGTFTTDRDMPREANTVWSSFTHDVAPSIEAFVRDGGLAEEPGCYVVSFHEWSDGDDTFVFDATTRRFLPKARPA